MKTFATPLAIEGTRDQLEALVPKLQALGYENGYFNPDSVILVTNDGGHNGLLCGYEEKQQLIKTIPRTVVPATSPDLVLALAAMVSGPEYHLGEWVVATKTAEEYYTSGNLYKISGLGCGSIKTALDDSGSNTNGWSELCFRKATKEEIINHFTHMMTPKHRDEMWEYFGFNDKDMDKKIIGYRLKKDLPFAKAGSIYTQENGRKYYYNTNGGIAGNSLFFETVHNTEWFEPVYEVEEKVVKVRSQDGIFEVTVRKQDIVYSDKNGTAFLNPHALEDMVTSHSNQISGFTFRISHVDIGCKKHIPVEDIEAVLKVYDSLQCD